MNEIPNFQKRTNEIHALSIKGHSAEEIASYMRKKGLDIKEKTIQRQMKILHKTADCIDRSRKMAEFLTSRFCDDIDGASRNIEMMHAILSELMLTRQDGAPIHISPRDAFSLARAVECLVRAETHRSFAEKNKPPKDIDTHIIDKAMGIIGIQESENNNHTEQQHGQYAT